MKNRPRTLNSGLPRLTGVDSQFKHSSFLQTIMFETNPKIHPVTYFGK